MKQPIIITIANQKGGVGKTTTSTNVAAGFAGLSYRVILIDCDVQGHDALFLGIEKRPALYDLIVEKAGPEVLQSVPGLSNLQVITSDEETVDVNRHLSQSRRASPATALIEAIKRLPPADVIVIDTAPSVAEIQFSALAAANWLLIPALPEYASEAGIATLVDLVTKMQRKQAKIELLGILPTMVQTRRAEHTDTLEAWKTHFAKLLLPYIRNLTELAEAPGRGLPIWSYAPKSQGAHDYAKALVAIKKRIGLQNGQT